MIRLTSRATVLIAGRQPPAHSQQHRLQGGDPQLHPQPAAPLRIRPWGVDADDDPVAAMGVGAGALCGLKFVPRSPEPSAQIVEVGVSNIILRFMGWIDRSDTDFAKARSWRSARSRSAGKRRVRTARADLPAADRSARRRAAWSSAGPGRTPDHTVDLTGSRAGRTRTTGRHRARPALGRSRRRGPRGQRRGGPARCEQARRTGPVQPFLLSL